MRNDDQRRRCGKRVRCVERLTQEASCSEAKRKAQPTALQEFLKAPGKHTRIHCSAP